MSTRYDFTLQGTSQTGVSALLTTWQSKPRPMWLPRERLCLDMIWCNDCCRRALCQYEASRFVPTLEVSTPISGGWKSIKSHEPGTRSTWLGQLQTQGCRFRVSAGFVCAFRVTKVLTELPHLLAAYQWYIWHKPGSGGSWRVALGSLPSGADGSPRLTLPSLLPFLAD